MLELPRPSDRPMTWRQTWLRRADLLPAAQTLCRGFLPTILAWHHLLFLPAPSRPAQQHIRSLATDAYSATPGVQGAWYFYRRLQTTEQRSLGPPRGAPPPRPVRVEVTVRAAHRRTQG